MLPLAKQSERKQNYINKTEHAHSGPGGWRFLLIGELSRSAPLQDG